MEYCLLPSRTYYAHLVIPCWTGNNCNCEPEAKRPIQIFYVSIQHVYVTHSCFDKWYNFRTMDDGQCAVIWHLCLPSMIYTADGANRQHVQGQKHGRDTLNACHSEIVLIDCHYNHTLQCSALLITTKHGCQIESNTHALC